MPPKSGRHFGTKTSDLFNHAVFNASCGRLQGDLDLPWQLPLCFTPRPIPAQGITSPNTARQSIISIHFTCKIHSDHDSAKRHLIFFPPFDMRTFVFFLKSGEFPQDALGTQPWSQPWPLGSSPLRAVSGSAATAHGSARSAHGARGRALRAGGGRHRAGGRKQQPMAQEVG